MSRLSSGPRSWEICILAGGRSSRMGRDKARLPWNGRSLLGHIRCRLARHNWRVRTIRRDRVPSCGPVSGVFTALSATPADAVLFLSCDMPFVSNRLLRQIMRRLSAQRAQAAFVALCGQEKVGFPFAIRRMALPIVRRQLASTKPSLQNLAFALNAIRIELPRSRAMELLNINTPEDWTAARQVWEELVKKSPPRYGLNYVKTVFRPFGAPGFGRAAHRGRHVGAQRKGLH